MMNAPTTAEHIRQTVLRIERLNEEIAGLNADKSEIFKEAKGFGLNVKALRALIAERAKEPQELADLSADIDLYRAAMDSAAALPSRARAHVREDHDPVTGEVVDRKVAEVAMKIAYLAGHDEHAAAAVVAAVEALAEQPAPIDLTIPASLRRSA